VEIPVKGMLGRELSFQDFVGPPQARFGSKSVAEGEVPVPLLRRSVDDVDVRVPQVRVVRPDLHEQVASFVALIASVHQRCPAQPLDYFLDLVRSRAHGQVQDRLGQKPGDGSAADVLHEDIKPQHGIPDESGDAFVLPLPRAGMALQADGPAP
jgi:hypothetical protein